MSPHPRFTPRNSLYNDQTWVDGDGVAWALEEMRPRHRRNLLAMLERRAQDLLMAEAESCFMYDGGEMAMLDAEHAGDELLDMDPQEWLKEQPLVARLRRLVLADGGGVRA